jgi:hypothetical protein
MKTAPKRIRDNAVETLRQYRDSQSTSTPLVQEKLREKSQHAFRELTTAMGCTAEEAWMVSENLAGIVTRLPPRPNISTKTPSQISKKPSRSRIPAHVQTLKDIAAKYR